jgi:hypothetical protein
VPQESFAGGKQVERIDIAIGGSRDRPLVGKTCPIDVQVRTWDFVTVRISVGRTVEVEPHQHNSLPSPVLVGGLGQLDLGAGHVEHEVFPFVERRQGKCDPLTRRWKRSVFVIDKAVFHFNEGVGLGLRDLDVSHASVDPVGDPDFFRASQR